jgi:hypothetical protein
MTYFNKGKMEVEGGMKSAHSVLEFLSRKSIKGRGELLTLKKNMKCYATK